MSKDPHPLRIPLILLATSLAGFFGLFLLEGGWDYAFFALSALPLVVGAWHWRRHAPKA